MKNCSVNKRATIFLQYGTVWYGKIALTLLMFGELRLIDELLYPLETSENMFSDDFRRDRS